ncbi:alpha,alpha-trehalose phosphorylase (configuration-retaining) [Nematocida parisii]|nr:alpha,alpha-trehalose phosphorylase (configuration-retaining) [Nematocida parisii]
MVYKSIFLGISVGVNTTNPSLDICIAINDGLFSLGTKSYSFPIINSTGEKLRSPLITPELMQAPETNDSMEMDEIRGFYISIEKRICLPAYFTAPTDGITRHMPKSGLEEELALDCAKCCRGSTETEFKQEIPRECVRFASRAPPLIRDGELMLKGTMPKNYVAVDMFKEEVSSALINVLIVTLDKWLGEYTKGNAVKIVGLGFASRILSHNELGDKIKSILWNKYDILPCFFPSDCVTQKKQSEFLARKCASLFPNNNLSVLTIGENNKVIVDSGYIWYCSVEHYRPSIGEKSYEFMLDLLKESESMAENNQKITFFSSTAQGGGVALMRHSLIRYLQIINVDAEWYVCTPSSSVFSITKMKVHNVLQNAFNNSAHTKSELEENASNPDETIWLSDTDKSKIDNWIETNYAEHWKERIKKSTVVVLDDHQVSRLAQLIKRDFPNILIIYRSHIQIRTDLMGRSTDKQNLTAIDNLWQFMWESLVHVDYFVNHPFKETVPADVPESKVLFQPAGTNQLDGLNKPLSLLAKTYYQRLFNQICIDNGENPVDFNRRYIVQVARFDPSKGINDLLDAYYGLFCAYKKSFPEKEFDIGLVFCGHGSVDDPEAKTIFHALSKRLEANKFQEIRHLITKISLPPVDQLLNLILQNAYISCQLSIAEGFEVKVTEALMKQVPVIVYNVGGLPLQVKDGVNGYIIQKGNISEVTSRLFDLLTDESHYKRIKDGIAPKDFIGITTPFQALFWLKMSNREVAKSQRFYKDFAKKYLN